ncbi:NlpC/P60 family protein [Nitrosovibrio sp. Nv6]|uniref:NlpC/P60 family protein n=1 Tax=Nitrosovibrio sp. Nv6 TaxID=1855340 RepID=UPI0008D3970F|nr:NlpC/P60 family protein [Nitrosovibrio sp. Nv6]SEO64526.1 NlpC/P60 family protein [Nitrosovibrio sp. Nv6]
MIWQEYIGIPWERGATGPHAYNCWNFVRHIQQVHFGRDLPQVTVDEDKPIGFVRQLRRHPARRNWLAMETPTEGDCVEMGSGKSITHIGVWVEVDGGGVLHCVQGMGVVFSKRFVMRADWPLLRFWRWHGGQHAR